MDPDLHARLLESFVEELEEQVRAMNTRLLAFEAAPEASAPIRDLFRIAHTIKGAARVVGAGSIERVCHELEDVFARFRDRPLRPEPSHFHLFFEVADALSEASRALRAGERPDDAELERARDSLTAMAAGESNDAAAESPVAPEPGPAPQESGPHVGAPSARRPGVSGERVRVPPQRLDSLLASAGDLLVVTGRMRERPREVGGLHDLAHGWAAQWRHSSGRLRTQLREIGVGGAALRQIEFLDETLDALVAGLDRVAAGSRADARELAKVTDTISSSVRALRMRPFEEACDHLPRAARDVAVARGKRVHLEIEGRDVEADRAVIDALREPLLHLVRNAVDHGIEEPRARQASGKPREGTVRVAAELGAGRMVVRVRDDGAGMDVGTLRERLRKREISPPERDADVIAHLFHGGLTSREKASEFSGRGVGLELVQWCLDRIGGSVEVESTSRRGTTFRLECPQARATLRALLVRVDSETVALASAHVVRVMRAHADELRTTDAGVFLPGDDEALPVRSLAGLLGPPFEPPRLAGWMPLVVLEVGGRRQGILVDELLEEVEVVVRALPGDLVPAWVTGGALLPDGRVAIVLNAAGAVAAGARTGTAERLQLAPPEARVLGRILVVDDSLTTRTLEQSVLEAVGYEVRTAADGSAGWRLLLEEGADLVVADVEMPELDGFELCERIRRSPEHRELPVVLVTALETPEHRRRGLEAGADAYLPKSSFDQGGLLELIRELIS